MPEKGYQKHPEDRSARYAAGSLTLAGAVSMGTGVMIGMAAIFGGGHHFLRKIR